MNCLLRACLSLKTFNGKGSTRWRRQWDTIPWSRSSASPRRKLPRGWGRADLMSLTAFAFFNWKGNCRSFWHPEVFPPVMLRFCWGVEDSKLRIKLAHLTISEGWSVRQCQQAVDDHRSGQSNPSLIRKAVRGRGAFSDLARALEAKLGRSVRIQAGSKGQGKLTLGFSDQNDLESILSSLDS